RTLSESTCCMASPTARPTPSSGLLSRRSPSRATPRLPCGSSRRLLKLASSLAGVPTPDLLGRLVAPFPQPVERVDLGRGAIVIARPGEAFGAQQAGRLGVGAIFRAGASVASPGEVGRTSGSDPRERQGAAGVARGIALTPH